MRIKFRRMKVIKGLDLARGYRLYGDKKVRAEILALRQNLWITINIKEFHMIEDKILRIRRNITSN